MKGLFGLRMARAAVCSAVLAVFSLGSVYAGGAALSAQQKQQFVQAAIGGAGAALKEKDQAKARAFMLASVEMVMKMARSDRSPQGQQIVQAWMKMRAQAWPGEAKLDPEAFKAFFAEYAKIKMKLGQYGLRFNMFNLPTGQRAYWDRVANIHAEYQEAQKFVAEFAMKAPPAELLVASPAVYAQISPGIQAMFNIMFGPYLAYDHAQKKVIPAVVKYGNENLDQAEKIEKAGAMMPQLNASLTAIRFLKTLDPKGKHLPEMQARHKKAVERMNKLYEAQVAQNRMPGACWKAKGGDELGKTIAELYKKIYPKDEIIKVNLTSDNWREVYEGWWEKDVWYCAYAGYVNAAVAVKQVDGRYRVFMESFRRTRNADGTWTGLRKWETFGNFRILPEHIK